MQIYEPAEQDRLRASREWVSSGVTRGGSKRHEEPATPGGQRAPRILLTVSDEELGLLMVPILQVLCSCLLSWYI